MPGGTTEIVEDKTLNIDEIFSQIKTVEIGVSLKQKGGVYYAKART